MPWTLFYILFKYSSGSIIFKNYFQLIFGPGKHAIRESISREVSPN
jgi:hypothetical protein